MYDIEKDQIRSLFPWKFEEMNDFVVGPRTPWNLRTKSSYKSTF